MTNPATDPARAGEPMVAAPIVIVGAGQAGVQAGEALRTLGHAGPVLLLGDEPHGPYHRPPLSKAWLAGEMEAVQLTMRAPEALARKGIVLRTGTRVAQLDRAARRLTLADGSTVEYARLVLATGATPRPLPVPAGQARGVCLLRSRDDASAIAARMAHCAEHQLPVVVVGGGFIGLEVAATARKKGLAVTVLEAAPRLLARVLAPRLSEWFAALHRGHGVQLQMEAQIAAIETDASGQVIAVRMADGALVPAGLVVVGIGVTANDGLAQAAGLECERGIVVDACGRTHDPFIFAAGDCTARRLANGQLLRLESVQNATEQGKSVAAALLGQERPFNATPWFWSDQYDKKLQMAGLSAGADAWAVRGDMASSSFSVYYLRAGTLVAVDSINAGREHLQARKLLDAGVSPTTRQASDTAFDLGSLLSSA
jgi:3-phenylpropionate/trans-cinnamate dioxygenase ferredoxin reductase subunit